MRATEAQLGILTGQRLDPESPIYSTCEILEIPGADAQRLRESVAAVVSAAETLHLTFRDAQAHLSPQGTVPPVASADGYADVLAAAREALTVPLDPERGPLFGYRVLAGPGRVWWLQLVHHAVLDGYGYGLLTRAVAAHYTRGEMPAFGPLAALAEADADYQASDRRDADRAHWTGLLAGRGPAAGLTDATAAPSRTTIRHAVPVSGLDGAWPHRVLAAVAAHVHRVTGSREVTLGLPVALRLGTPAARTPAMAMNIVPLALDVDPAAGMDALTTAVAARLKADRPHHAYRYEHLRRDLGLVGGGRMWGPVVNIIPFVEEPDFGGGPAIAHPVSAGPVDDLSVTMRGPGELLLEANPALYTPADLERHATGILACLAETGTVGRWRELPGEPAPEVRPVLDRIREHIAATPARVAIVDGEHQISYGRLGELMDLYRHRSAAQGVGPGHLLGIAMERGHAAVATMLTALDLGAGYLPLDPSGPRERNAAIVAEARPAFIAGADHFRDAMPAVEPRHEPAAPAYVIYTSGSTGRPKGVVVGRAALDFFVSAAIPRYGITAADRVLQFAPLHFDAAVEEIFCTLAAGATLVIRDESALESPAAFLSFVEGREITVLDLPTAYWHELVYALDAGTAVLPSCVRTVIIGGEAALPERVRQWFAAVGTGVRLINTYGPTETTVVCLAADLSPEDGATVPIGRPLPGVRAFLGPGEELLIGGPGLASGYLERPELSVARWTELGGVLLYRTGDRVREHVGDPVTVGYVGRVDDELKISGHRIHPQEVEAALLTHPSVREAAVVPQSANGRISLTAHVVSTVDAGELRAHAAARLTGPAVPRIHLVAALPRTPSGKIDRRALAASEITAEPVTGSAGERLVAGIWAEVLGAPVTDPAADFFALGGGSLQAVAVAARLSAALGRPIGATLLFAHPTVAGLTIALSTPDVSPAGDTMLADSVLPAHDLGPAASGDRILLTGATGFVGAHLLDALSTRDAEIVCAVRGGASRLAEAARRHGLPEPKATVVAADFPAAPEGAFAEIWHCAAEVSLTRGYASMRAANVLTVAALLESALRHRSRFHQVSTVAVGAGLAELPEDFVPAHDGLRDGYQRGKWAAEELVRQAIGRGLRATVHRLGRVTGGTERPYINPADLVWRLVRAGLTVGALPDLDVSEPWTPADWATREMAAETRTGVVNLVPTAPVRLRDVWAWIGEDRGLPVVPLPRWRELLAGSTDPEHLATAAFFDLHEALRPPRLHGGRAVPAVTRDQVLMCLSTVD
ncbi:hypothetical protein Afil01_65380 [Actinorhabdospora filicis]|uniref:Carrier domain-containing protein n=1 Tax=Actinorhabdospora filicis TaxID=1785913 RepID=A0A9W6SVY0_9ACTN|nr:AMP-binding protein [Actinorhabdospora filicis]GLZ81731.1 hypothetical protein Afil01_65380 [Actinorhabdospora filicis]